MDAREAREHRQRGRRVLPDPGRHAADRHLVHLEAHAGRGEAGIDLGQAQARPIRVQLDSLDHRPSLWRKRPPLKRAKKSDSHYLSKRVTVTLFGGGANCQPWPKRLA